jgi:DNA polymerase III delta subunit
VTQARIVAYSGDPLLAERALARALAARGPVRRVVLFGDEPCLDRLLGELTATDLFGEPRAIVVRRADGLVRAEPLAAALANGLPPDLALYLLGETLNGPVVRLADEAQRFASPTGRALRSLAGELLAEADLPRPSFVVDLLVEAAGGDTLRLAQEVEKLTLWKGARLPRERLPELLFSAHGAPYAYLDAVGTGELSLALAELRRLLAGGLSPSALFFILVGHVRALLVALSAHHGGRAAPGPTWLVRRRLDQARRWGEARLVGLLASLQALDLQIKTGQLSPEAALHLFTLRLAQA